MKMEYETQREKISIPVLMLPYSVTLKIKQKHLKRA